MRATPGQTRSLEFLVDLLTCRFETLLDKRPNKRATRSKEDLRIRKRIEASTDRSSKVRVRQRGVLVRVLEKENEDGEGPVVHALGDALHDDAVAEAHVVVGAVLVAQLPGRTQNGGSTQIKKASGWGESCLTAVQANTWRLEPETCARSNASEENLAPSQIDCNSVERGSLFSSR
jgi:hypothetical protein